MRELSQIEASCDHLAIWRKWTFDLGQNMVGVVRLKLTAPAGTVDHPPARRNGNRSTAHDLHGEPARRLARDTYICKGGGEEIWQPKFTFHGFRYVELTGLALGTDAGFRNWHRARHRHAGGGPVGDFGPADQPKAAIKHRLGPAGNYLSVPTDCPQRDERYGWMGSAQTFIRTATYNASVAAFSTKWMVDVNDSQVSGAYPGHRAVAIPPAWARPRGATRGVICPWTIYQMYGDKRILEKCSHS